MVGFFGFDSFKGISDGVFDSNFGAVAGLNAAMPLLGLSDYGFGWQLGMSYGAYDWTGGSVINQAKAQQQVFVTTGFFRKARRGSAVELRRGLRLDDQRRLGCTRRDPTMGQWRGQAE